MPAWPGSIAHSWGAHTAVCILIVSSKRAQHSYSGPVPTISREGVVHQGGRTLIPALCVHVCRGLAELGPPVQPVGGPGILCVFACIIAHTDNLTRYRVCQLAYCSRLGPCCQSIHKTCCLWALLACSVSSLSIQSLEAPKLRLIGLKAAHHCCTAPARLCLVLATCSSLPPHGPVLGWY